MNRDLLVYAILLLLIAIPVCYIGTALFSKNTKGQWDESSRERAQMRRNGWNVRATVDNAAQFVTNTQSAPTIWPIPVDLPAINAVTSARRAAVPWRCATIIAPPLGTFTLVSVSVSQRSDGAELEYPQTLLRFAADGGVETVSEAGDTRAEITSDMLAFFARIDELMAVHLDGARITYFIRGARKDSADSIAALTEQLAEIVAVLPSDMWR
ncbi:hypothetical protein [Trueperella sp. LYQ143]|uniref:hypothetical protein n=1 Tax=unclassified Trueperella TaxID=2630174 RepID=UPI00398397CB